MEARRSGPESAASVKHHGNSGVPGSPWGSLHDQEVHDVTQPRRRSAFVSKLILQAKAPSQDVILAELRRVILDGGAAPGAQIPLDDVAEFFGVSLIPVRESLRTLIGEELVDHRQRSGLQRRAAHLAGVCGVLPGTRGARSDGAAGGRRAGRRRARLRTDAEPGTPAGCPRGRRRGARPASGFGPVRSRRRLTTAGGGRRRGPGHRPRHRARRQIYRW